MTLRQLLSASLLYGLADMLVVGVGGFLLLPLYTHALTQAEFGMFVIVRTNIEIIGYLITFGLLTAVSRLYFDHRGEGQERSYFNSILVFFAGVVAVAALLVASVGGPLWRALSPNVPVAPYIWLALLVAIATFVAGLGSLWLRLDNRVFAFVAVQVVSSALLAVTAFVALVPLDLGLAGLLAALAIGYLPGALVLLVRIGGALRPTFRRAHVAPALGYGAPIMVSYIAYFLLNRFSLLTLQRHVSLDEIAVFGLAQTLALIVSIAAASAGKAMQPAVFGADPADAPHVLRRASRLFIVMIFAVAAFVTLFAQEAVALVAPDGFSGAFDVLLILIVASFVYALSLVSNTALDLHRRPKLSAAVTIAGAALSVALSLLMIPPYGLSGAALATLGAFAAATALSHWFAWRLTRQSYLGEVALVTGGLVALAFVAAWPGWGELSLAIRIAAKLAIFAAISLALAAAFVPAQLRAVINRSGSARES